MRTDGQREYVHAASLGFGRGKYPYAKGSPIMENILTWKDRDDWTAQLAMMEQYDQHYNIYDHEAHIHDDPLSIIGMHPAENTITGSRLELMCLELVACRIPELTNTPLLELLNYPRWILDRFLDDGRKVRKAEEEEAEKMRQNLESLNDNPRNKKRRPRGGEALP